MTTVNPFRMSSQSYFSSEAYPLNKPRSHNNLTSNTITPYSSLISSDTLALSHSKVHFGGPSKSRKLAEEWEQKCRSAMGPNGERLISEEKIQEIWDNKDNTAGSDEHTRYRRALEAELRRHPDAWAKHKQERQEQRSEAGHRGRQNRWALQRQNTAFDHLGNYGTLASDWTIPQEEASGSSTRQ
jgi:hypothetical protein